MQCLECGRERKYLQYCSKKHMLQSRQRGYGTGGYKKTLKARTTMMNGTYIEFMGKLRPTT